MLVEELVKCTPDGHADCKLLQDAARAMTSVALKINVAMHEYENRLKVCRIANVMAGMPFPLVEPHRCELVSALRTGLGSLCVTFVPWRWW